MKNREKRASVVVAWSVAAAVALFSGSPKAAETSEPKVALFITLCLWSPEHPAETCREVPLTPGPAGPGFDDMKACQDGQEEAMRKWREQAGPLLGFTAMAGEGYRIKGERCGAVVNSSSDRDKAAGFRPRQRPLQHVVFLARPGAAVKVA